MIDDVFRSLGEALNVLGRASLEAPNGFVRRFSGILVVLLRGLDLSVFGVLFRSLAVPRTGESPRQRTLGDAIAALQSASRFVQELEDDLQARTSQLLVLQERYEHLEQLTAVEQEKARAILGEVEETIGRGRRREYVAAFVINAVVAGLFFGLGLWVAQ